MVDGLRNVGLCVGPWAVESARHSGKEAYTMPCKICLGAVIAAIFIVGAATAPSATAAPTDDACSLLTQAQVSAALGASVGPGSYQGPPYKKTCTWTVPRRRPIRQQHARGS